MLHGFPTLVDLEPGLADPGADRIVFWDESDNAFDYLTPNTGISISGNNLNVSLSSFTLDDLANTSLSDPNADRIVFWDDSPTGEFAFLSLGTSLSISTTTLNTIQGIRTADSPTFTGLNLSGLTASRLMATDGSKNLASVSNLASWVAGTSNQVSVSDDGDGSITLSTPQNIGTGSSPTFAGLTITGLSGVLKAATGVVSGSATMDDLANTSLSDPNADRIVFWDDSPTGEFAFLATDSSLTISGSTLSVAPAGVDHNSLANLTTGDVHTHYALLAGRSGGQSLTGGTASGNNLTLLSTSHGTKGKIILGTLSAYDQVNDRFGQGTTSPAVGMDVRNGLNVGISAGAGTASDTNLYSSTGDYTTGTISCTNNSVNFTGSGTTFTADMVGHEIVTSAQRTGQRLKIATITSATTGTFENVWRGTTGAGQTFTIYGGSVVWDSGPTPSLTVARSGFYSKFRSAFGSGGVIGGTTGTAMIHAKEDIVAVGSVSNFESGLEFEVRPRAGGGLGIFSALQGKISTPTSEDVVLNAVTTYAAALDVRLGSSGLVGVAANFFGQGDVRGPASSVPELYHLYLEPFANTGGGGTVDFACSIYLPQQTVGATSVQVWSDDGDWKMGGDVCKLYQGADQDIYREFDGSNWKYVVAGVTSTARFVIQDAGLVVNEDGRDSDTRFEGDSLPYMLFLDASAATENIAMVTGSAPNWQSMDRGIFIGDATTVPTGNPSGGGFLYVESGALKYRGSGGTITTLGAA